MKSFFITATDTGVGKSVVSTLLAIWLNKKGYNFKHFKPVQSGATFWNEKKYPSDLFFSSFYLKGDLTTEQYCEKYGVYSFEEPLSPDFAAERSNVKIRKELILEKFKSLSLESNLIVEGAGGASVPLFEKYLIADLISDLQIPVIIVSRPKLGTLNHTYLTVQYLKSKNIEIKGIIVSDFPENPGIIEKRNIVQLEKDNNIPVLGVVPHFKVDTETPPFPSIDALLEISEKSFSKFIF